MNNIENKRFSKKEACIEHEKLNDKRIFDKLIDNISSDLESGMQINNLLDGYQNNKLYEEVLRTYDVIRSIKSIEKPTKFNYAIPNNDYLTVIDDRCRQITNEAEKSLNVFDKIHGMINILRTRNILTRNYLVDKNNYNPDLFDDEYLQKKLNISYDEAIDNLINTKNPSHIFDAITLLGFTLDKDNLDKVFKKSKDCFKIFLKEKDYISAAKVYYLFKENGYENSEFNIDYVPVSQELSDRWNQKGVFNIEDLELVSMIGKDK